MAFFDVYTGFERLLVLWTTGLHEFLKCENLGMSGLSFLDSTAIHHFQYRILEFFRNSKVFQKLLPVYRDFPLVFEMLIERYF